MAVFTFKGNQVAEWSSIDDATLNGDQATEFGGISTLDPSDTVSFEIDDSLIKPDGTFDLSQGDIYITVTLNGTVIAEDIKLKLEEGGDSKEYGDTFLVTDDAVDLNGDGNTDKLVFLARGSFVDGEDITLVRDQDDDDVTDFDTDFVCFAKGTPIRTVDGERSIESLAPGDLVWTVYHGFQPVVWIGSSDVTFDGGSDRDPPVLIKAGALGNDTPRADLIVSSQHRIFVGGFGQVEQAFTRSGLVPAKSLVELPGIRFMRGRKGIEWYHLLFERHQLVAAAGAIAESLLVRHIALSRLPPDQRQEVMRKTGFEDGTPMQPAAPLLKVQEARRAIRVSKTRGKPVVA